MQGNIIVNLKDGLNINKIIGTYPLQHVFFNDKQLLYHFTDLKPKAEDDLIIWYQGDTTSTFETLHPSSLYKQVDETDTSIVHRSNLTILEKTDFDTPLPGWSYILWTFGIIALLLIIFISYKLIYLIYKFIKNIF